MDEIMTNSTVNEMAVESYYQGSVNLFLRLETVIIPYLRLY